MTKADRGIGLLLDAAICHDGDRGSFTASEFRFQCCGMSPFQSSMVVYRITHPTTIETYSHLFLINLYAFQ